MTDSNAGPDNTAKSEHQSNSVPSVPTEKLTPLGSTFRKIGLALMFAGAIAVLGAAMVIIPVREGAGGFIAGAAGLILCVGLGLAIASLEPQLKRPAMPAGQRGDADFRLVKLAEELRRPFFRWHEILVVVCLTVAPMIIPWLYKTRWTPWSLFGLAFPAVLVGTVILATLAKKYDTLKRAFLRQLPAAKRAEFLELLHKR